MRQTLHDRWWRLATSPPRSFIEHLVARGLSTLAVAYAWAVRARLAAYARGWIRQHRLSCPVISVGNLTVGGTGKTTCVAWLAGALTTGGRRVGVLSRGYGGRVRQPCWLIQRGGQLLCNGQADVQVDGLPDEPQLLAAQLPGMPVLIGRRRERTGRQAIDQFGVQVLILDDGFQYRRLHRDCEIVLVHARMPLGGWPMLPRGPMREPLSSLRRADVVILTNADQAFDTVAAWEERVNAINPGAVVVTAVHEAVALWDVAAAAPVPLDRLEGLRALLVSSIGDPDGFEQIVRQRGAQIVRHAAYPDHHRYAPADWHELVAEARTARAQAMLTTEKDWVRLRPVIGDPMAGAAPVWTLRIRMQVVRGGRELDDRLAGLWHR